MRLDVYLSNGKYIVIPLKGEVVLEKILNGTAQFIEMRDKDGTLHFVNVDHIVEAKECDKVDYRQGWGK